MKAKKNVPHNSQTPPLEPILIPEAPVDPARMKAMPGREIAPVSAVTALPARSIKKKRKPSQQRFTLNDAFDYFCVPPGGESNYTEFQNERCVKAVAFLLHYTSAEGNENVNGAMASGLANILEACSGNIAKQAALKDREREILVGELDEAKKK